jgi:hypothetical protein
LVWPTERSVRHLRMLIVITGDHLSRRHETKKLLLVTWFLIRILVKGEVAWRRIRRLIRSTGRWKLAAIAKGIRPKTSSEQCQSICEENLSKMSDGRLA